MARVLNIVRYVTIALLALMIGSIARPSVAASAPSPEATLIQNLADQTLHILGEGLPDRALRAKFKTLLEQNFDLPAFSQSVLGSHWRTATPQEQSDFQALFADYVVYTYWGRFKLFTGYTITVTGTLRDEAGATVSSVLQKADHSGEPKYIKWSVGTINDKLRVSDVKVEGISLIITHRQEAGSVVIRTGSVTGLNNAIRAKLKELE